MSFGQLTLPIYSVIDVLLYLDYNYSLEFFFNVNRHMRHFLVHNYEKIKRAFENEGLMINYLGLYNDTIIFEELRSFEKLCEKTV